MPTATNAEIAVLLDEIGDLLELQAANPFRVRAYRNAARLVRDQVEPFSERIKDEARPLTDLPGIGEDLADKIRTLARTGRAPFLNELRRQVPAGLREMITVPALGPKRALVLFKKLGVKSKAALLKAAKEQRIRKLKGFGEKTEAKILAGVVDLAATSRRYPLAEAKGYVDELLGRLRKGRKSGQIEVAGSYRRGEATVGDIDILASGVDAGELMDRVASYAKTASVLGRGPTRMSVRLRDGLQVDVRVVAAESFGAALVYFTGSKAHNIELRRRAQTMGLKINEYGVYRGTKRLAGRTEEDVYRAVGLRWIPPGERQARGEIAAAELRASNGMKPVARTAKMAGTEDAQGRPRRRPLWGRRGRRPRRTKGPAILAGRSRVSFR